MSELTLVDKVCFGALETQAFDSKSMYFELDATPYNGRDYIPATSPKLAVSLPSWPPSDRLPPLNHCLSLGMN